MGDGKFGVNMPPLHPLCRCTTVPYYEEIDEDVTRIARNKDDENIEIPHDMSYEEWKEKYISKRSFEKGSDNGIIISGGISGARKTYGAAAEEHAKKYYGLVRSMKTDVQKIAKASGYSEEEIQKVKNYIFIDEHDLGEAGYK